MSTKIYYFSATGNSLQVARDLAGELGAAEITSITGLNSITIDPNLERLGIVFPVYAWGVPLIVSDFLKKIEIPKGTYVFAVVTCGAKPGGTLLELNEIFKEKGIPISAGFSIQLPDNYIIWSGAVGEERQHKMIQSSKGRIREIAEIIKAKGGHKLETNSAPYNLMGSLVHKIFIKNSWREAENFWVTEKCNQCAICVKVCPVNNISLAESKPSWDKKCQQCLACIHWCPQEAIQYKKRTLKRKRYHHPEIKVTDLYTK